MRVCAAILPLLLLTPLASPEAQGQSRGARRPEAATGSICLAPVTPNDGERPSGNPSGGRRVSTYSIQVDAKPKVFASSDAKVKISGLSTGRKHLVKIYGDGELVESFRFRFGEFETQELCLWFNSLYETWSLWDAKDGGSKCRCAASGR